MNSLTTNSQAHRRLIAALADHGPMTKDEMVIKAHVSRRSLISGGYMERLLDNNEVHIAGWERAGNGKPIPTFAHGPGKNVPKPTPYSDKEKHQRYRDGSVSDAYRKMRARRKGIVEPLTKDVLMNALFGMRSA